MVGGGARGIKAALTMDKSAYSLFSQPSTRPTHRILPHLLLRFAGWWDILGERPRVGKQKLVEGQR